MTEKIDCQNHTQFFRLKSESSISCFIADIHRLNGLFLKITDSLNIKHKINSYAFFFYPSRSNKYNNLFYFSISDIY